MSPGPRFAALLTILSSPAPVRIPQLCRCQSDAKVIAVLFYDHLLTFEDEYRWIWRSHFGKACVIFWLVRYIALIAVGSCDF